MTTAMSKAESGALGGSADTPVGKSREGGPRQKFGAVYVFLTVMAVMWLVPLLWAVYTSLRSSDVTKAKGYFSWGGFTLDNYSRAWTQGTLAKYFVNSAYITIPAVLLTLFLASLMAFAVSRYSWKFNVTLLIMFTAGNMLPPQVLATPLFQLFKAIHLPYTVSDSGSLLNTYYSIIIVNVAFQLGFCTFVMSNYMRALPIELTEAAMVDGAGVFRQYWSIVMPLCRPAIAALATLETIFIYNDFFWALLFIQNGDRLPITTGINALKGQYLSDYGLIAAGAVLTVIPTLLIYAALQRQFVAGLTLGANKG
ncbi:carbohydrate ABC transporter permease [Jatrophihabitans sp. YIM 134969]